LIFALVSSYKRQLDLYRALSALVQRTLSQVVLTRGDISGLMGNFTRKRQLLDSIENERATVDGTARLWQERKAGVPKDSRTQELDGVLQTTQSVIREFLDGEEQLKKYLEHVMKKGTKVS
jgi:hypothetical protein